MNKSMIVIISISFALLLFLIISLIVFKKKKLKRYKNMLDQLDLSKNLVSSIPITLELSKVEPIIKNEDLENRYKSWPNRERWLQALHVERDIRAAGVPDKLYARKD